MKHGLALIVVLAALGGAAAPRQIAAQVAMDPSTLARIERHLTNAGCVAVRSDGSIEIASVITSESMALIADHESRYASTSADGAHAIEARGRRPRCNAEMPRAQARCILPRDHAGGHRSR